MNKGHYYYEFDQTEGVYKVWYKVGRAWHTLIAICQSAEKADFLAKAANQFDLDKYLQENE